MSWMKENKILVASVIVGAICLGCFSVIMLDMVNSKAVSTAQADSEEQTSKEKVDKASEEVNLDENPFGGKDSTELTEEDILNYMHGMSHQKVIAEEKWLHYEMTTERINYLIAVVENGPYEHEEVFLDILHRWSVDDFSEADKDHNKIWRIQGGTIGEATGVMTAEQEQLYLEENKGSIE
ncbi:DUF6241 domain-containing protein [Metabacillus endolithicus]|uniref:DUF6241 domain-containing protein n=1 Tax=Metabacillus endolithicus TaxID=1535204 RepID=A0ABW5C4P7_9BACI|nr:DUF6241 domain-containing protein [Metabacillus endolithicus]UPG65054.1 DUF6241 domain-containing protein [Metabacillus endolithicus]